MDIWYDLPPANVKVLVSLQIEQQMARALCSPQSSLGVLTEFANSVVRGGEEVKIAFRVPEIKIRYPNRRTVRIFTRGRGAPAPIVLVTDQRIVFGRYKLGWRTKDSNWTWAELVLSEAKSVSSVHRGRFEVELPSQQATVRLIFAMWMFRLSSIRRIRDAVANAVNGEVGKGPNT
jgi:hypothetical protein